MDSIWESILGKTKDESELLEEIEEFIKTFDAETDPTIKELNVMMAENYKETIIGIEDSLRTNNTATSSETDSKLRLLENAVDELNAIIKGRKPKKTESQNSQTKNKQKTVSSKKDTADGLLMKKIIISDECSACGSCALATDLIIEGADGKAVVREPGIVRDDMRDNIQRIIDDCPSNAISFGDYTAMVKSTGAEGLRELKGIIREELGNYTIPIPAYKDYKFDKAYFHFPYTDRMGNSRSRTDYEGYRTENKAESAGRAEFDSQWYSRLKTLIQTILVDYKDRHLRIYYEYSKDDSSNYYLLVNQAIEKLLGRLIEEAQAFTDGKLSLPYGFEKFEVVPQFESDGAYKLLHFEDIYITNSILDMKESLSWYTDYIDTSSYDKDYNYDLSTAVDKLEEWTLSDIAGEANPNVVGDMIEDALKDFDTDVQKAVKEKADFLINAIDKIGC